MILIYSNETSPRLEYTIRLVFHDILGSEASVTHDSDLFRNSPLPKISYSEKTFTDGIFLKASPLLFYSGTRIPELQPIVFEGETGFFGTSADSCLPFDPLASAFLVTSRMEEYNPEMRDRYGRFPAIGSFLYRYSLLEKPVVNRWARLLASKMEEKYGKGLFPEKKFTYCPTIDVDNAWAYRHKGFIRTSGGFFRDLLKGNSDGFSDRLNVLINRKKDPYDTFSYLKEHFKTREEWVRFFFLLGNYSKYDKPVSWKNRSLRRLVSEISRQFQTGIHPSLHSSRSGFSDLLITEKERLEKIICSPVLRSRQHYLMLRFPETYLNLIKAGISEDYSMGYPELPGFRAGICTPFNFYDLINEQATDLKVFPFQIMEVTLAQYMGLNPEKAGRKIETLMEEVKATGGMFCSIWHNESLSDQGKWKGYREIFEKMNEKGFRYANGE